MRLCCWFLTATVLPNHQILQLGVLTPSGVEAWGMEKAKSLHTIGATEYYDTYPSVSLNSQELHDGVVVSGFKNQSARSQPLFMLLLHETNVHLELGRVKLECTVLVLSACTKQLIEMLNLCNSEWTLWMLWVFIINFMYQLW